MMHRSFSYCFIFITGLLFSYPGGLRAEGGYKPGTYSFFVTSIDRGGNEQYSLNLDLTIAEDSKEPNSMSATGSDSEPDDRQSHPESSAGSGQNGNRFKISIDVPAKPEQEESNLFLTDSVPGNEETAQSFEYYVPAFSVLPGSVYTIAQGDDNFATADTPPLALLEYGQDEGLFGHAISGVPVEQILNTPTNPFQNALSHLPTGSTILANLPVVEHLATGLIIYPVFTFTGFIQLTASHGATLLASAHPCTNCLCRNCCESGLHLAPNRYCTGCHCCPREWEKREEDSEEADALWPIEPVNCNGPVDFPGTPGSNGALSPPSSNGALSLGSDEALSPENSLTGIDSISPPPDTDNNLSPLQSSISSIPGSSASPEEIPSSPLSSETSESGCPGSSLYTVQITLTPDNSAIAEVSYHFQNGDVIIIHVLSSAPTVFSEPLPEPSSIIPPLILTSIDQLAKAITAAVLLKAMEKHSAQNKQ